MTSRQAGAGGGGAEGPGANIRQQATKAAAGGDGELGANTALIDSVRKFVTDVRELDIDLIDRINPLGRLMRSLPRAWARSG